MFVLLWLCMGGLAIGDPGGIPGGPTGLGLSKIPAHCFLQPAHPLKSPAKFTEFLLHSTRIVSSKNFTESIALTEFYTPPRDLYSHSWCLFFEKILKCLLKCVLTRSEEHTSELQSHLNLVC